MHPPEFWTNPPHRPGWQARLLAPLGVLYGLGSRWRLAAGRPADPGVPVICVGNLTLGGTGKTPVAIALLERLKAMRASPVALSRGYGGVLKGPVAIEPDHTAAEVGDEPLLLARHAPAVVARDRAAGAALCVERGAGVIVMDDGFQNPALTKTLSIAVVDAATGFGNGRVFPAGPLREFVRDGLKRADAVVLMGEGPVEIEHPLVLKSRLVASLGPKARPKRAVAFAGIGRPEKFVATLTGLGIAVAEGVAYPDHYAYREEDIIQLRAMAERHHAELVTTEKDLARLPPRLRRDITAVPVEAVFEDEATLTRLLELALAPRATAPNRI